MAFSLPQLPGLSKLFSFEKKSQSVLGVDVGSSAIKVVQLRRDHGRAVLETYGAIALGPYGGLEIGRATQLPVEKMIEALKDLLREANVTTAQAGFAIPYTASLISTVKLPAAAEKKLDQTMPLEARKYIPVPINEVQLDWTLISGASSGSDKIEVMLVAIHNGTIDKYRQIASGAALTPSFFEIEVFSAVRASLDRGIAPVAVVDIGAATTKLYVVERGIVRESHLLNRGSQELTLNASRAMGISVTQAEERKRKIGLDPSRAASTAIPGSTLTDIDAEHSFELSLAPLLADVSHTLASFESRAGASVSAVVFTGGGASMRGFLPFAQGKLSIETRVADPFGKTEAPAFLEQILKEAGPEFSVAVGLALRRLQELG